MYQQKRVCPPNYLLENSHNKDKKRKRPSNKAVHLSLFPRSLKAEIFFFFCLSPALPFSIVPGLSPAQRQSIPAKLLKTS